MISEAIVPPAISLIRPVALFSTVIVAEISVPFSNREAASVLNPCRNEVLRVVTALKKALSKKIFFEFLDSFFSRINRCASLVCTVAYVVHDVAKSLV